MDQIEAIALIAVLGFLGFLGVALLGLSFAFRQMVLAFVAGVVFLGVAVVGWTNRVETYDVYGMIAIVGIVLVLVSFICGFLVQHQRAEESRVKQQRYSKEFPPPVILSEEEAYGQELDREIGQSVKAKAAGEAKALRQKYREMMNR